MEGGRLKVMHGGFDAMMINFALIGQDESVVIWLNDRVLFVRCEKSIAIVKKYDFRKLKLSFHQ